MLLYLWTADFSDGTRWEQPRDDVSILRPEEKSSKFDFMEYSKTRTLARVHLFGGDHAVHVDCGTGRILVDGKPVRPGDPLPAGCSWIEGDPVQGPYFRRVTKRFSADRTELSTVIQFCLGARAVPGVLNYVAVTA